MGEESEDECTSSFLVGDFQITAKDVGSCEGSETNFVSEPKEDYKSDLCHLLGFIMKKRTRPHHLGVNPIVWWKSRPP